MKAILVIDMPNDMNVEETKALNVTLFNGLFVKELKIDCPLKPMPEKKILDEELFMSGNFRLIHARFTGWNDCIDTITGETE